MKIANRIILATAGAVGFIGLLGCAPGPDTQSGNDALVDAYFRAGIQTAISVHLKYQIRELKAGKNIGVETMPADEWEAQTRRAWLETHPNEHYVKAP